MKIESIALKNFRCHADLRVPLNLAPITVIGGENGAGKTSILAGLEYVLTGRCHWTDGRGAGADTLIRHGAGKAAVSLELDGDSQVVRTIPNALVFDGAVGVLKDDQVVLFKQLGLEGAATDQVLAALNCGNFLDLSPQDQQTLLFRATGGKIDDAWWRQRLGETEIGLIEQAGPGLLEGGPEVLDALYGWGYEARRDAKQDLEVADRKAKELGKKSLLPEAARTTTEEELAKAVEGVRAQLLKLRSERDETLKAMGAAEGRKGETQRLEADKGSLERQIAEQAQVGVEPNEEAEGRMEELRVEGEKLEAQIGQVTAELADLAAQERIATEHRDQIQRLLNNLDQWKGQPCPTCGRPIEQPELFAEPKQEVLGKREEELVGLAERMGQLGEAKTTHQARLREINDERTELQSVIKTPKVAAKQVESLQADLSRVESRLKGLQGVDEAPSQEKVDGIEARIRNGEALLESVDREVDRKAAWDERDKLDGTVAILEELVKKLGPKGGLRAEAVTDATDRFTEAANEAFRVLGAQDKLVDIHGSDKGLSVVVQVPGGAVPAANLSGSERLRLSLALQHALIQVAGWELPLVIDEVERLDKENRRFLFSLLPNLEDAHPNILVLVSTSDPLPAPTSPDFAVLDLRDGQLTVQTAEKES